MPETTVPFSTGFENYLSGALLYNNVSFSNSITYTSGTSLWLSNGFSYVYYKLGPAQTLYTSFAFRLDWKPASTNYRCEICDVSSENAIPDLYPAQNNLNYWFGSRWYVTSDMVLGAVACNGVGFTGRTNYATGDFITPPAGNGEYIRTLFTDYPVVDGQWYWLETKTTVDFTTLIIDDKTNYIVESTTSGRINGKDLGEVSAEKWNPNQVVSMVQRGISPYPTVLRLYGSSYHNIYYDNLAGTVTTWPGEGVSNG